MVGETLTGQVGFGEFPQILEKVLIGTIDDGGMEPLDECSVGLAKEAEGLADLPTSRIKVIDDGAFDGIRSSRDASAIPLRAGFAEFWDSRKDCTSRRKPS